MRAVSTRGASSASPPSLRPAAAAVSPQPPSGLAGSLRRCYLRLCSLELMAGPYLTHHTAPTSQRRKRRPESQVVSVRASPSRWVPIFWSCGPLFCATALGVGERLVLPEALEVFAGVSNLGCIVNKAAGLISPYYVCGFVSPKHGALGCGQALVGGCDHLRLKGCHRARQGPRLSAVTEASSGRHHPSSPFPGDQPEPPHQVLRAGPTAQGSGVWWAPCYLLSLFLRLQVSLPWA